MIGRKWSTSTSSIPLAILFACLSFGANADCDLLSKFNAVQANGFNVVFELDDVVDGQANGSAHYLAGPDLRQVNGQANGTFDGLSLTIDVHWENGSIGHYEGRMDPGSGQLAGATKDLSPSGSRWVKWSSKQHFDCVREPGASPSAIASRCGEYARTAVQQNDENVALRCGFTDARWNPNQADHENWCRGVDPAATAGETAARKAALETCREQVAQKRELEDKSTVGDLLKKPRGGVGDILNETKP
jgi:hypothetical protein